MDDEELSLEKLHISGPTLASIIQCLSSSSGNVDGLLFGHVNVSPSNLSDSIPDSPNISATITSFISSTSSSPFYTPSGNLNLLSLRPFTSSDLLIGWFSGRLRTPLRPSMRESSVTSSLSSNIHTFSPKSPCIFLLLTTPFQDQLIHTYEYRAYQFRSSAFELKTLDVVNIGPGFGGHYTSFCPNSPFPRLHCEFRHPNLLPMAEDESDNEKLKSMMRRVLKDQKQLNMSAEGFEVLRLSRLIGSDAADYTVELEDLYNKMLAKLDGLARLVEKSSARVLEQEKHNMKLRCKVGGLG